MKREKQDYKVISLVSYNSKIEPEFKQLLDALVIIQKGKGIKSQRELLHAMASVYEKENPEDFKRAREVMKIYGR